MTKKIRAIGAMVLLALWAALSVAAWFAPPKEISMAERRPLNQFPELSGKTILNGEFMKKFEDFTLDQFPGRDLFRQLKAMVQYNVMLQKDNNGIYIADGSAVKLDYPIDQKQLDHALDRFNFLHQYYLNKSKVYFAIIPDKAYYTAAQNGYPAMDYEKLFDTVKKQIPWATHIDITDCLTIDDYYRTDTHWRQENLLPVAQKITAAMGVTSPKAEDFTVRTIDYPFYGVYYGQAALPMAPDQLKVMESKVLKACKVYTYDDKLKQSPLKMYNEDELDSGDPYNMYLSGARMGMVRIENPNAKTDRELIVFRDSFGSSLTPLLVQDYKMVTLIDIREIASQNLMGLSRYLRINFAKSDVLMLYSTTVLNIGNELK